MKIPRRRFLQTAAVFSCVSPFDVFGQESPRSFKIGICDWDLKTAGHPKNFALAKELGFDGVEVSYLPTGEFSLSQPKNRELFLEAAQAESVEISSLAMATLNQVPLATSEPAEGWVADCIETMEAMKVKNVLLAFFGNDDIKGNVENRNKAIEKLQRLAPKAAEKKVVLGFESYLNAKEHLDVLEKIGNDAVKVYYDIQNMLTKEYPIYDDMELLLKEKVICQLHSKEYGSRLGQGKVDFPKVRALLEKYDYQGWLVVESSVDGDWKESQKANVAYLRKTFRS
ncbi:MAG: sugar phosphate isomerase/epimerase [Planctomycetaceae bacterium]|nr:sugar phosphate isomerase/epimerase [Planctomycetaceae bacterium]